KSYQDPTKVCQGSYPYTITNAHMFLQIAAPATITVALDVEQVDTTFIPGCPVPGDMVFLGDLTDITFPEAGLYDVDILFDQPVVVDGPFFLGFFFATSINAAWDLALITDNARTACVSYNIWDTAVGYIDLGDVQSVHQAIYPDTDPCFNAAAGAGCFEFDGRIILHTSGSLSDPAQCCVVAGDANHDARVNISDITFIISYLFSGGAAPSCNDEADANSDGKVNIADITGIIEFLFAAGPAPACGTSGT
ncbi:MAG: dockerin type I repeat-containing protein, partial [Candidatus Zixiibacteriota bacterium]